MTEAPLEGIKKVELSDGSKVLERDPEPLGHLVSTPADQRAEIDGLIATMPDLSLTREASQARDELVALGKPPSPALPSSVAPDRIESACCPFAP